jgi:tetratricopeptide (TPR) repeat protein
LYFCTLNNLTESYKYLPNLTPVINETFILILSLLTLILFGSCRQHSSGTADTADTKDELAMLTAAIEKNDKDPSLLVRRAKYYTDHQKLNDALLDLNRALELDSRNSGALLDLSNVYILMGKPQQALDALNRLVEFNPGKQMAT